MKNLNPPLQVIVEGVRPKHYPKGQIIFYQGDHAQEVAILSSGYVKLYDINEQGNEKILHLLGPNAVMPLSFFSGRTDTMRWFYAALTDCDVYMVKIERLQNIIDMDNKLALSLMHWFGLEVQQVLIRLSSLGKSNAKTKIIAVLSFLATNAAKERPSGWCRVNFPVNHQLLADLTGVTRESATMIMKELVIKGCVRNPRQTILEIDKKKLN